MAALNNCDGYPFALWQGLIPKYQFNFKYIAWISNRCLMGVTIGAAGTTFTVYYIPQNHMYNLYNFSKKIKV